LTCLEGAKDRLAAIERERSRRDGGSGGGEGDVVMEKTISIIVLNLISSLFSSPRL